MSKLTRCVFAALACLVTAAPAMAAPMLPGEESKAVALTPAEIALKKAYEALAAQKADEAIKLFREAGRLDPKSIFPLLGLADAARMANDTKTVEEALKKAMEIAPERAEPVIAMARWQFVRKAYDEAETLLRKAAKMDPKSPVPLVDLGDLYSGIRKDPDRAMEYYREATRVAPKHAGAHYALGSLLLSRRDALGAITSLELARDLAGGNNPLPSLALGKAYGQARKWKDAQEAFTRALTIEPKLAEAYLGRASSLMAAGNHGKALEDLRKAEELAPKSPEVPMRIGMIQQEAGAFQEAYAAYERAIRIEPKFALAYNNLAWLAASRRERLDEALAWIRKAREIAPKETLLHDTHGWVLRARGDLDGAMAVLTEGIGLRPTADLHYHLGVIQMEVGRHGDARDNLRKALQLKPDFGDATDAKQRLKQLETQSGK